MYQTTGYNGPRGGIRRFNLTTKKNGVVRPNYTYTVQRPYTPRALPNITSSLASRWAPGKEQKFFHTHDPQGTTWNAAPNADVKTDGYFIPLLQRTVPSGPGSATHYLKCGAGPSERIGLKITLKKLKFHGVVSCGSHSSNVHGGATRLRLMLVEDRQANGAVLTHANSGQLLQKVDVDGPLNPVFASKFKVLWDRVIDTNQARIAITGATPNTVNQFSVKQISFSFEKNLNTLITYQGTTGEMSEVVNNNYYLFVLASKDTGAAVGQDRVDLQIYYEGMLYFDDS